MSSSAANSSFYPQFSNELIMNHAAQPSKEDCETQTQIFSNLMQTHFGDIHQYQHDSFDFHSMTASFYPNFQPAYNFPQGRVVSTHAVPPVPLPRSTFHPQPDYSLQLRKHTRSEIDAQSPTFHRTPVSLEQPGSSSAPYLRNQSRLSPEVPRPAAPQAVTLPASDTPYLPDRRLSTSSITSPSNTRLELPLVIACCQCRARKIRCDSTRPVCNNCVRRSTQCVYDTVPKRRGPDKRPGTRRRSCKKRSVGSDTSQRPPKRRQIQSADVQSTSSLDGEARRQQVPPVAVAGAATQPEARNMFLSPPSNDLDSTEMQGINFLAAAAKHPLGNVEPRLAASYPASRQDQVRQAVNRRATDGWEYAPNPLKRRQRGTRSATYPTRYEGSFVPARPSAPPPTHYHWPPPHG